MANAENDGSYCAESQPNDLLREVNALVQLCRLDTQTLPWFMSYINESIKMLNKGLTTSIRCNPHPRLTESIQHWILPLKQKWRYCNSLIQHQTLKDLEKEGEEVGGEEGKEEKQKQMDKIFSINIRILLHARLVETRRASCIDNIPCVTVMLLVTGLWWAAHGSANVKTAPRRSEVQPPPVDPIPR